MEKHKIQRSKEFLKLTNLQPVYHNYRLDQVLVLNNKARGRSD